MGHLQFVNPAKAGISVWAFKTQMPTFVGKTGLLGLQTKGIGKAAQ